MLKSLCNKIVIFFTYFSVIIEIGIQKILGGYYAFL